MEHSSLDKAQSSTLRKTILPLTGIILLTLALRLFRIEQESAWLDEVFSLIPLRETTFTEYWASFTQTDPNATLAPAYFITQFLWAKVFGTSLIALRLYSVTLSTLTLAPLFLIGRRLFNTPAALATCLLFALSLPHIAYAQEVRMHVFATLFAVLSMWAFLVALETNQKHWWGLNGLFNAIMLLSSPMTGLLYIVQGLILLSCRPRHLKRIGLWTLGHILIIIPCFVWFSTRWGSTINPSWMGTPSIKELLNAFIVLLGGRFSNDNPTPYLPIPISLEPLLLLGFLISLFFLLYTARKRQPENTSPQSPCRPLMILLTWLIIPMSLLFLLSITWKPVFLYRYLLYSSFPIYLIIGGAWGSVQCNKRKATLLLFLVMIFAYQNTVRIEHTFRPDYQATLNHMMTTPSNNPDIDGIHVLVLKQKLNGPPLSYLNEWETIDAHFAPGQRHLHDMTLQLLQEHQELWVLMWRWDRMEEYENLLISNQITMTKSPMGGMPIMYLYLLKKR